jgi:thiol-disulfide isomerase/thioredoxin
MIVFATRPILLAAATLLLALAPRARAQESGIAVGEMAPAAMVETLEGTPIDLASYYNTGKPVVLEFWATWCPLCRQMEPKMQAARSKFAGQVTFVSVGVSANQSPARQKAYAEANGMGGEFVFDRDDRATRGFKVPHTSYVVVLDGQGRVTYTGVGPEQDIEAAIRSAMP